MLTAKTTDTDACAAQIVRLAKAGCDIVRLTVPTLKDAQNLKNIRRAMDANKLTVPLVADIHFTPQAAFESILWVDKIRINPGNFADTKKFARREYSDTEYRKELERIEEVFSPLALKLKAEGKALRIGVNHGSLSDRIMNRYGDTPEGMTESALEFARICVKLDFHALVFSMKASSPRVTVQAYRLLAARMREEKMDYPFHLGVTEAGTGEDGRIKSAIGIGALLLDGIGDTLRVSLTEKPEEEIAPGRELAEMVRSFRETTPSLSETPLDPYHYRRQQTRPVEIEGVVLGGEETVRVVGKELTADGAGQAVQESKCRTLDAVDPLTLLQGYRRMILEPGGTPVLLKAPACLGRSMTAAVLGALLLDGIGDAVWTPDELLSFDILQNTGIRLTRTEFISCPGCGRTSFDLIKTAENIKRKLSHLPGLRIAVMGCIVNGPGEMADADFGYVGAGNGKIDLYHGKECAERGVPENQAVDKLIELIKIKGKWIERDSRPQPSN
jgi:(E)-4-hydroxy-3-methylbut-2-enyl-diphosphate synthase